MNVGEILVWIAFVWILAIWAYFWFTAITAARQEEEWKERRNG